MSVGVRVNVGVYVVVDGCGGWDAGRWMGLYIPDLDPTASRGDGCGDDAGGCGWMRVDGGWMRG